MNCGLFARRWREFAAGAIDWPDDARIGSDQAYSRHDRSRAVCRLMQERDREIDPIFGLLRCSPAVRRLMQIRAGGGA